MHFKAAFADDCRMSVVARRVQTTGSLVLTGTGKKKDNFYHLKFKYIDGTVFSPFLFLNKTQSSEMVVFPELLLWSPPLVLMSIQSICSLLRPFENKKT